MQTSMLKKTISFYVLISVLLLLLFHLFGGNILKEQVIAEKKSELSTYSHYIQEHHFDVATDNNSIYNTGNIALQIAESDQLLGVRTWIVNGNGGLILDSANEELQPDSIDVLHYCPDYFDNYYYANKSIPTLQPAPMLSVILPVSSGFHIKGYVVIHYPMEKIQQQVAYYQDIGFTIWLLMLFVFGISIFFIWFTTIRPTQRILRSVSAANQGEYNLPTNVKQNDELGTLDLELEYMREQLKNLDNYQKHFIANVSHDFRSPLTSIRGYAIAMQDGTIPPELHGKYLDVITFEVDRLTKLTSNLLSLNQFEQGGHHLDITSFDINRIIKQTAATFEGHCNQKRIKLKLIFSEKETFVNADQSKIQQILYNLLDNAIKFSNKDSEIHIRTVEKREKVLVSVKDFGIGIPKDGIKKIWERFYKTDLSRGKDKKGTGLGLSITKEIINAHNENINVISTEGAGTEFTFTLTLTTPNEY